VGRRVELTAQELLRIKAARGPDALACFSSAKCSNEENYVMMRMFRAAIGTNNVDHCTRLCHSTSVAAMQRALNTSAASGRCGRSKRRATSFSSAAPIPPSRIPSSARLEARPRKRATLIVADPRRTELAARADIHLQLQPGTDVALYSAMLNHILSLARETRRFIAERTHDFDKVRARCSHTRRQRRQKLPA